MKSTSREQTSTNFPSKNFKTVDFKLIQFVPKDYFTDRIDIHGFLIIETVFQGNVIHKGFSKSLKWTGFSLRDFQLMKTSFCSFFHLLKGVYSEFSLMELFIMAHPRINTIQWFLHQRISIPVPAHHWNKFLWFVGNEVLFFRFTNNIFSFHGVSIGDRFFARVFFCLKLTSMV